MTKRALAAVMGLVAASGPVALGAELAQPITPPAQLGNADSLTLPNLVPLPPYDVFVGVAEHPQGAVWSNVGSLGHSDPAAKYALRFSTIIQNKGRYAFELTGGPWLPNPAQPDITTTQSYQCVRFTGVEILGAQRNCVRYDSVGTLTWHAQHRHFHINGFGRYELRRNRHGQPDFTAAGLVGRSQKVGWCVSDMWNWRADPTRGEQGAVMDFFTEPAERNWYQECTSPILYTGASWRQGISPGWADTYPAAYTGQEIPLRGVADGTYWLVTTINPKGKEFGLNIQETTWADNTSASRVQISDGATKARLLGPMPREPYRDWFQNPRGQPGE